ncbi:MAG: amidohydrolase family protein [Bacteroidota bacterium]
MMKRISLLLVSVGVLVAMGAQARQVLHDGNYQATYDRLEEFIDNIKVVNTHEHQRIPLYNADEKVTFYSFLSGSYLSGSLRLAGAGPDISSWVKVGKYLDFSRNTSTYDCMIEGFRILYGFEERYFTEKNIDQLNKKISENYARFDQWYDEAFEKAGYEVMLNDQWWKMFESSVDSKHHALVFHTDGLAGWVVNRGGYENPDSRMDCNPYAQVKKEGVKISSLDDYLEFADGQFRRFVEHGAVCAKAAAAYERSIFFEQVEKEEAAKLYNSFLKGGELSPAEEKKVQDFMYHFVADKCAEYDLPLQIHTGLLAGGGNLDRTEPQLLEPFIAAHRDTKMVLFHGGVSWYAQTAVLAASHPNVYVDIVGLPGVSRTMAAIGLHECLDTAPYNKIFAGGGDCRSIEESAGVTEYNRSLVAQVLAERVVSGRMTEEVAQDVAIAMFRGNAISVYNLKLDE